jgi:hypothetical protein
MAAFEDTGNELGLLLIGRKITASQTIIIMTLDLGTSFAMKQLYVILHHVGYHKIISMKFKEEIIKKGAFIYFDAYITCLYEQELSQR